VEELVKVAMSTRTCSKAWAASGVRASAATVRYRATSRPSRRRRPVRGQHVPGFGGPGQQNLLPGHRCLQRRHQAFGHDSFGIRSGRNRIPSACPPWPAR
jgi:hypothetical protein